MPEPKGVFVEDNTQNSTEFVLEVILWGTPFMSTRTFTRKDAHTFAKEIKDKYNTTVMIWDAGKAKEKGK